MTLHGCSLERRLQDHEPVAQSGVRLGGLVGLIESRIRPAEPVLRVVFVFAIEKHTLQNDRCSRL